MRHIPFDLDSYRSHMQEVLSDRTETGIFWKALDFSVKAHENQWRRSGDAYILHPCSVAMILAEEMDILHPEILASALLHDTVEDVAEVTTQLVREEFGIYVQAIVEGCTKVTHDSGDRKTASRITYRKLFSGAASRPEVMLVKLADRLHNLRTLRAMPKAKRQRIADETIAIYAPLATVFGLFNLKREMYNLALLYKYPKQGARINSHIRKMDEAPLGRSIVAKVLEQASKKTGLRCTVTLRTKKLWAYFDLASQILVKQIDTPMEILVVVESIADCYIALGVVNQTFKPIPRTMRDFIANPKPTGYQGLHARAIIEGQKFLFKIRTEEMERKAQKGLFRNWSSKRKDKPLKFIRELKEMFDVLGSEENLSYRDVIAASGVKEIYTYTPQGDLICLPVNSTVLDFAFRVHTEIGQTCLGAIIRNRRYEPSHVLHDGDMVKIIRADKPIRFEQHIQAMCKTARARGELAKGFRIRRRKVSVEVGRSMLRQEMLRYGIAQDVLSGESIQQLLDKYKISSVDEFYTRIGEGILRLRAVMDDIKDIFLGGSSPLVTPTGAFNRIELTTLDPVSVKLSSCCKPNPTALDNCALLTSKGLSVHHKKCERFHQVNFQREDAVNIVWDIRRTSVRKTQNLHILRAKRKDLMRVIGFAPEGMEFLHLELLTTFSKDSAAWDLTFTVQNLYELQKVIRHFDRSHLPYEFVLES